jgi:predicted transposase YdaD
MYDNTCRFLAEHFSADFASWLLGKPVTLTELQPSELSLDPIRADALIFLESDEAILHIEFQTLPKDTIPFRMLDYRVRGHRKSPGKPMRQVTRHEFEVIRLWEQPASLFLQYPGLIPFAALGQSADAEETLRQAAQIIDQIADPQAQANLMAASGVLAGLKLDQDVIYRVLRRDIMQESTVYRSILEEGLAEGKASGLAEGKAEGKAERQREIAMNLLSRGVSIDIIAPSTGLSVEEVQRLQQQVSGLTQS